MDDAAILVGVLCPECVLKGEIVLPDGFDMGYEAGYTEGHKSGYSEGTADGEAIGYEKGHAEGYEDGYTEGAGELDHFWDAYQQNGERTDYDHAFKGVGWNNTTFTPKYKMYPISAGNMFHTSKISGDLRELAIVDFGQCTSIGNCFMSASFDAVGIVDCSKTSSATYVFYGCEMSTIELFILKNDGTQSLNQSFTQAKNLQEIRFGGLIGKSIDLKACPLSVASMKSTIEHLQDFNGSGKEFSQKLSISDTCWANLDADSTAPNGSTWKEYVGSLGWNT